MLETMIRLNNWGEIDIKLANIIYFKEEPTGSSLYTHKDNPEKKFLRIEPKFIPKQLSYEKCLIPL